MTNLRSEAAWLDGAYEGKGWKGWGGRKVIFLHLFGCWELWLHSDVFSTCESACAAISQLFRWMVVVEIAIRFS